MILNMVKYGKTCGNVMGEILCNEDKDLSSSELSSTTLGWVSDWMI